MDGVLAFGDFRLDLASERLERDGKAVALTPKSYCLLRYFLAHPERLLDKDELLDAVWPDATVSDTVLKVCVGELRRALADDAVAPRYVATVHRRGYRFVAAVSTAAAPAPTGAPQPAEVGVRDLSRVVGRTSVLAELDAALRVALDGTRQVVFVTGEAGIGKTTVVDAFLAGLDPAVLRARGQCLERYGQGEPYLPLLDALGRLARSPAPGHVLATLRRTAPTWMAALPGIDHQASAAGATAAPSRTRMLLELVEALEALTQHAPLALVLEDLHWSDYSTIDLLSLLARRPDPARLIVIATYRPVEIVVHGHPLGRLKDDLVLRRQCREIALEFLSADDVEQYLELRLESRVLSHGLAALVHARTDGNPLFMTHVVDMLLTRGSLTRNGETWTVAADVADDPTLVPDTLRHMIAHELARLAPDERRVLEAASVAGIEPAAEAVAAALGDSLADVEDIFMALARRGQMIASDGTDVWPDGTRTARFGFIHALYQSTLYQQLAPARRAELHQRMGERLERGYASAINTVAPELAQHFTAAGDVVRARLHLRRAAERAFQRHAYPEAIGHLERALATLAPAPDDVERAALELDVHMALGPALMALHGFGAPEVERCYARARALCRTVGATPERAHALRGLALFSLTRGDLRQARELAEEAVAVATSGSDAGTVAKAEVTIGTTLYYLGELDASHAQLERARRVLSRARTTAAARTMRTPLVNCLAFLAMTTWFRGRPDSALAHARAARAAAELGGHPSNVLWAAHVAAILHHFRGEPDAAAEAAAVAIRLANDLGFRQWIAWGVFFHGWLAATEGRVADGITAMQAGMEEYRATGAELGAVYFTATLAGVHADTGDTARARTLIDASLAETNASSERYFTAELHRLRAGLLVDAGAAEPELRRAVALADRQGNRALALRAATDLARVLDRLGHRTVARRLLAPRCRACREGHETADVRAAHAMLATLGGSQGADVARARATPRRPS